MEIKYNPNSASSIVSAVMESARAVDVVKFVKDEGDNTDALKLYSKYSEKVAPDSPKSGSNSSVASSTMGLLIRIFKTNHCPVICHWVSTANEKWNPGKVTNVREGIVYLYSDIDENGASVAAVKNMILLNTVPVDDLYAAGEKALTLKEANDSGESDSLKEEIVALKNQLSQAKKDSKAAEYQSLKGKFDDQSKKLVSMNDQVVALKEDVAGKKKELADVNLTIGNLKKEVATLKKAKAKK